MKVVHKLIDESIELTINTKDDYWYDENGDFRTDYLLDDIGQGELVEVNELNPNVGYSMWVMDDKLYTFDNSQFHNLLNKGKGIMNYYSDLKDYVNKEENLEFLKWYLGTDSIKEIDNFLN